MAEQAAAFAAASTSRPMARDRSMPRFHRRPAPAESIADTRLVARAVAAAKRGDRDAVQFLYSRYADNVYGYVCSIVRDEHEAEDITQNVFLKLLTVIGKYEERSVPFLAWVLRVARNVAVDHMRQRRAFPCAEVRDPELDPDEGDGQRSHTLRDALTTLPTEQREVLVLRHLVGLSPGEIAERLGKTEGSVHALHHRGRRAAQRELRRMEGAPATRG